jgi:hypothetical protein
MDSDKHVQFLQTVYAGALAETVLQFGKEGVLAGITARKRQENLASGKMKAAQFGISKPEEVFIKLSDLFGCAVWNITSNSGGIIAQTGGCKLCAIAKKIGASSPCRLYCLDPMEGMVKALKGDAEFVVEETLWEGPRCSIRVNSAESIK